MKQNKMIMFLGIGFVALIFLLSLSSSIFLTIQPGQNGVLFKRFAGGLDTEAIYGQGFHVIAPWNKMFVYDIRVAEDEQQMDVLSKNGLEITIEMSYRYKPKADKIGYLHQEVGSDY
ncbi:MAG: prohibitin family protein, partial [Saprospiraceae bacterium]|nr:prohibitin family protein [Saprospiraceae bacterium]